MKTGPRSLLLSSALALTGGLVLAGFVPISAQAATSTYQIDSTITVGNGPRAVELNPVTHKLYVANEDADTVSVIDLVTGEVTSTVPVGDAPSALAVNTITNKIYVVNSGDNTVSIINGAADASVGQVAVGAFPYAIAVNETTNQIFVANLSQSVSMIDGLSASVTTFAVGSGTSQLTGIAVNEATNALYVVDYVNDFLWEVDVSTGWGMASAPVGDAPFGVAFNEVTNTIYATNLGDGTVTVIDAATFAETALISVGVGPFGVEVDPSTNSVFVANSDAGTVSVIDGTTNLVDSTVALGATTRDVAVDGVANRLYATSSPSSVAILAVPVAPALTVGSLPSGSVGSAYSATITTTGSNPIAFAVTSGALPAGLSLNPSTGVISGTPTAAGSVTFTITATNAVGSVSQALTIITAAILPPTGFDAASWFSIAALMLLAGGALVLLARRAQQWIA